MPFTVTWSLGGVGCGCGCGGTGCPVQYRRNRDGVWVEVTKRPSSWLPLPERQYDASLGAALERGAAIEAREHPGFTTEQARQIAADHLRENPRYYGNVPGVAEHCHCPPGGPVCRCPTSAAELGLVDPESLGAVPEGCGLAYTDLVRATGGRTEQYPNGQLIPESGLPSLWCNQTDAEAWAAQAGAVFKLVRGAWNALMKAENEANDWTHTEALRASVTAYDQEYESLPEPSLWMAFGAGGCSKAVAAMIANIKNGACQLELLNRALQERGAGIVPAPAPGPTDGGGVAAFFGGAGTALVVGALVFLLASRR